MITSPNNVRLFSLVYVCIGSFLPLVSSGRHGSFSNVRCSSGSRCIEKGEQDGPDVGLTGGAVVDVVLTVVSAEPGQAVAHVAALVVDAARSVPAWAVPALVHVLAAAVPCGCRDTVSTPPPQRNSQYSTQKHLQYLVCVQPFSRQERHFVLTTSQNVFADCLKPSYARYSNNIAPTMR